MVNLEEMSEQEAEVYVRELASSMLANASETPVPLFIMAAIEASVRATIAVHLDENGETITSVEALKKLQLVIDQVIRIESETTPNGAITH